MNHKWSTFSDVDNITSCNSSIKFRFEIRTDLERTFEEKEGYTVDFKDAGLVTDFLKKSKDRFNFAIRLTLLKNQPCDGGKRRKLWNGITRGYKKHLSFNIVHTIVLVRIQCLILTDSVSWED